MARKRANKIITTQTKTALDKAAIEIERARAQSAESKQPRFTVKRDQVRIFLERIFGTAKEAIYNEPKYSPDSTKRDAWLARVVKKEPYLLGILQSVVSVDKNRGWTLTGGKIQTRKFTSILHNFQAAPDLNGWRNGLSVTSQAYYQADIGGIVEVGRSGKDGPLAALYAMDPTQCQLTGNPETPLRYLGNPTDSQSWTPNDYFRVASFPSTSENMHGLGYCAVSRCIELAKLMVSVIEHDREQLGSKAPKGILTIKGVSQEQWLSTLEESQVELKQLQREYYSGVQVLANELSDIEVNLTPLSNLPEQFDHKQFVDMIIYGYALAFGYDPREFWPVSSGALGTATETESQHRRASSKGGLDFALGFQEKLQEELPESLQFEFEQRDVEGDIAEADLKAANLEIIRGLYESANAKGENMITWSEARQLLVEANLIHEDWTPEEEEVIITDTDDSSESMLEKERVRIAMEKFPDQEIVSYSSRDNKFRTIYDPNKRTFQIRMGKKLKKRAYDGNYEQIRAAYYDATYTVVRDYLLSSDRITSYKSAMARNVVEAYAPAAEEGYRDGGGEPPFEDDVNDWLTSQQAGELANVDSLFVSLKMLRDSGEFDAEAEADARANGYANTLDALYSQAMLFGAKNKMLTWRLGATEVHCSTCAQLDGQRHKASWYIGHGYIPRQPASETLECGGWNCDCSLQDDDGNEYTI